MAVNTMYKYVWLVKTIYDAGKISLAEINKKWVANDISRGVEISKRTFLKWRNAVEDIFGLVIENENKGKYRYYIVNPEVIENNALVKWQMHSVSVSTMLMNYKDISKQVILECIPYSDHCMMQILEALKLCRVLSVTYKSFHSDEASTFMVHPLGIKLFRQRWYLLAYSPYYDERKIYAFDRIQTVDITDETYTVPCDLDLNKFFDDYFGVIINDDTPLEKVRIKVTSWQACYFRTLPLHKSQKEVETNDGYSIFEYDIHPTFDFQKELLSHGPDVEVLAPTWLRNYLSDTIQKMNNQYE